MSTADTMKVRVRDRSAEAPWGSGPVRPVVRTVEISTKCPVCGGKRGKPANLNQVDDGEYYSVDVWTNPCGHVDYYEDVVKEAAAREQGQQSTRQPSTPAEKLRAAAAKLREMAKGTTRGPWFVADCELYPRWILTNGKTEPDSGYAADVFKSYEDGVGVTISDADWAWMAFAHPGLAGPIAAWLEETARQFEMPPCDAPDGACNGCERRDDFVYAFALAELINGSAS